MLKDYGIFDGIDRIITCQGDSRPELVVSPQVFDFAKKIISTTSVKNPNKATIFIANLGKITLSWEIDTSKLEAFSVAKTSGTVSEHEKLEITAYFDPYAPTTYS